MRCLRALIISADATLRERIAELLLERRTEVQPVLALQRCPEPAEAARHLNLCRPDLVLLGVECVKGVVEFLRQLEAIAPSTPVVGISRVQDPRALAELMQLGMRDCLAAPLNRTKFHEALQRIVYLRKEAENSMTADSLVCFLPARGGSGTSTLACNISQAMSLEPEARVLLADFDTVSGVSRFVFKLTPSYSLGELVAAGRTVEDHNWRQCVLTTGHLHVIHGGQVNLRHLLPAHQIRPFLESVSQSYTAICADLTGSMETYALELMRRAKRILLVSTTDTPSIELACEKLQFLNAVHLLPRVRAILTLVPEAPAPDVPELHRRLGVPVEGVFDFGGRRVRECLEQAALIDGKTPLGRQIAQFASQLRSELANDSVKALH